MEEKIKNKFADWAAFVGALFIVLANPAGILGAAQHGVRAGFNTVRRYGWEARKFVGEHIAWPVAAFYMSSVLVIDALVFFTARAANMTGHWSWWFLIGTAAIGMIGVVLHVTDIIWSRYKHPERMPLVTGAILYHVWLRLVMFAVVAHAIAASSELAMIPAVGFVMVLFVTGYVAALALGWIANKSIELIEAGGTAIASPIAAAPEVAIADIKRFMDLFRNDAWRAAPLKIVVDEISVHAIFLLLVSFWPTPAMAAIVGVPVYATGLFGIVAKLNGSADKVKERREAFIWRLYKWAWIPLFAARLVAEIPVIKQFWASLLGRGEKTLGWATDAVNGNFRSPLPVMDFWTVALFIVLALVFVHYAWQWSKEWGKWGKAVLRVPAAGFLVLMLAFGLPNASCGSDDGEDEAEEQVAEESSKKSNDTPPPAAPPPATQQPKQAVTKPAAASSAKKVSAPAKAPSEMSQEEINSRLADIAARRKAR